MNVLVTAIGSGGLGEQSLKALNLASNNFRIFGTDINEHNTNSLLVEEFFTVPSANAPDYLKCIGEICKSKNINIIIPGSEAELKSISDARTFFQEKDIFLPINNKTLIDLCMDKRTLNNELMRLGFRVPKCVQTFVQKDLENVDFFPVIVKPRTGGKGSSNVYIAQNMNQLLTLADYLNSCDASFEFLVQEYVGRADQEFTVGILHDHRGRFISSIALKRDLSKSLSVRSSERNLTDRNDLGEHLVVSSGVSQGVIGTFPAITEQCRNIAEALGSTGPINVQCRYVEGDVVVFEINPRFSGTSSMRAMVGINEPEMMINEYFQLGDRELLLKPKKGYFYFERVLVEKMAAMDMIE